MVYKNTGTSVTVAAPAGFIYYAAVYTFNTTASYGTPAVGGFQSQLLGSLHGIAFFPSTLPTLNGTNIPLGGVGLTKLMADFVGGGTSFVDITASQATYPYALSVDNTNVVLVTNSVAPNPFITITGQSNGFGNVIASLGGFFATNTVQVRNADFVSWFTNTHDYALNGTAGTIWDGVYNTSAATATPGNANQTGTPNGVPSVISADENITTNGWLTVTTTADYGWENGMFDGFFLFKYLPGDFFMAVQPNSNATITNGGDHNPGVLARFYGPTGIPWGTGTNQIGAAGTNFNEWNYSMSQFFGQFGIGPYTRDTRNNATIENVVTTAAYRTNYLIALARAAGTNWYFFAKANTNSPWVGGLPSGLTGGQYFGATNGFNVNTHMPQPVQVGIMDQTFNGVSGVNLTQWTGFVLDTGSPQIFPYMSGGHMFLQYPAIFPLGSVQATTNLTPTGFVDIGSVAGGATSNGMVQVSVPLTNSVPWTYFRLRR